MDELQMLDSFSRKKRIAIEEELKKAQDGGIQPEATPIQQNKSPEMHQET